MWLIPSIAYCPDVKKRKVKLDFFLAVTNDEANVPMRSSVNILRLYPEDRFIPGAKCLLRATVFICA